MISLTTERFRALFSNLPKSIRRQARDSYRLFRSDPYHPSLRFKLVHPNKPIYSVRITRNYRTVGIRDDNQMIWFWRGSHAYYNQLLKRYRSEGFTLGKIIDE